MTSMGVPRALTIAGSDNGGGAGIQADIKTFQELDVYGMTAITAIAVENTLGVYGVYPLPPEAAAEQIEAVGSDIGVDALKTGMLFSADIICAVVEQISKFGWTNVVVDPVMIAKGGGELLRKEAVEALKEKLLPLALIVTPNIPEAEVLSGISIRSMCDRREAARRIRALGPKIVVIKGGHDTGEDRQIAWSREPYGKSEEYDSRRGRTDDDHKDRGYSGESSEAFAGHKTTENAQNNGYIGGNGNGNDSYSIESMIGGHRSVGNYRVECIISGHRSGGSECDFSRNGDYHQGSEQVVDLIYDGEVFTELTGKRVHTVNTHGTGCTFSAAITAELAKGSLPLVAIANARAFIQAAIEDGLYLGGGNGPTNHWAYRRRRQEVLT